MLCTLPPSSGLEAKKQNLPKVLEDQANGLVAHHAVVTAGRNTGGLNTNSSSVPLGVPVTAKYKCLWNPILVYKIK